MQAGRPDPNLPGEAACTAPITLAQDTIIGFEVPVVGFACTKVFAQGATGTIDCDGGTAHNVEYSIDSNGNQNEAAPEIRTRLGRCCTAEDGVDCAAEPALICDLEADPSECEDPYPVCSVVGAGPGAATIETPLSITVTVAPGNTLQDCDCLVDATTAEEAFDACPVAADANFDVAVVVSPLALTTEIAQGMVMNPSQGGTPPAIEGIGSNFSCSTWTETDSDGILEIPLSALDQVVVQDTINIIQIGDRPTELP
jgi:hypothetical protein